MSPGGSPPKDPLLHRLPAVEHQDPVHPADDEKTVGGGGPSAQNWRVKSCSVHCGENAGPERLAGSNLPRNMAEQDALPNPVFKRTGVTFVAAGAQHQTPPEEGE